MNEPAGSSPSNSAPRRGWGAAPPWTAAALRAVGRVSRAGTVPLVLVGLIGLGGLALSEVYRGPLLAWLVGGAAVGSVGISVAVRRAPAWSAAPGSVLALAGYLAWVVQLTSRRADVPGGVRELAADALANGIPRLLTALIPVEPQPDTVVVPVVAAWLAGLAGTELAIRSGRTLLGYVPPTLWYVAALYAVGPNAGTDGDRASGPGYWPALGFAALAALGLAVTGRPHRPEWGRAGAGQAGPGHVGPGHAGPGRRAQVDFQGGKSRDSGQPERSPRAATGTAAGLAAVLALIMLLGPPVAGRVGRTPVDPRRYVEPPQLESLDENPLSRISGWVLEPNQRLFDLQVTTPGDAPPAGQKRGTGGAAEPTRVRLATLSDYDGVTWRVGAHCRSAGRALPPGPADGPAQTREIRQEITIAELAGALLPAIPTPRVVDGVRVAYDPGTGTLLRPEGLRRGLRYAVTSAEPRPDVNLLPTADAGGGSAADRMLELGADVPDDIRRLATQLGADNSGAFQRAQAVEAFLAEHYRLVADAPSGHAYPNLSFFLFGPHHAGGRQGTSEQFAAAFAVLARVVGLPTRVVVGFEVPPGTRSVRAAHALAWPEVLFDDIGWVAFRPLPTPGVPPRPVEEDFRPKPDPTNPPPSIAPTPSAEPPATASPGAVTAAPGRRGGPGPLASAGLVVAVLLGLGGLGYLVLVPLWRHGLRRRRLGAADPAGLVIGAWWEVTDALRLAGHPIGPHWTVTEVSRFARTATAPLAPPTAAPPTASPPASSTASPPVEHPAGRPLDCLADLVNRAAFAPEPVDPRQARTARDEAAAFTAALRARRSWWRRLLWWLHPGPLRWYR